MKSINIPTRWTLTNFYNGLDPKIFIKQLEIIKETLIDLEHKENTVFLEEKELSTLSDLIRQIDKAESFYYCLTSEEIEPSILSTINTTISSLKSHTRSIISNWVDLIKSMNQQRFDHWSKNQIAQQFISTFPNVKIESKDNQESIVSNFAKETLKGYEDLYTQIRNNLKVRTDDVEEKELTFSKADNMAMNNQDPIKRTKVFEALNSTLKEQSNVFASIYNQMFGIRINVNKVNKEKDCLEKSLKMNGLSYTTLQTMWTVIDECLPNLIKFLEAKAREGNKEKISWHELMSSSEEVSHHIYFSKAVDNLTKALDKIDTNMSKFVNKAITNEWVDSGARDSKAPGGFCAPFLSSRESRISLNYDHSIDSARILAHELGHAWHFHQLKDSPSFQFLEERFEMTIAETSSIFFETAFIDYVIQDTKDFNIKKALIGWKIERSFNYLMSIRGAFLFEKRFYEERLNGPLSSSLIEEISLRAQEEVYGGSLTNYQPFVWIKYSQFYQSDVPFYNYPYTFGFLLSIGLLEQSKNKKEQFSLNYQAFLSQTGTLPVEQLINHHFNIDLSQPDFWRQSINRLLEDVDQYLEL